MYEERESRAHSKAAKAAVYASANFTNTDVLQSLLEVCRYV
jgi:hypothetical protein